MAPGPERRAQETSVERHEPYARPESEAGQQQQQQQQPATEGADAPPAAMVQQDDVQDAPHVTATPEAKAAADPNGLDAGAGKAAAAAAPEPVASTAAEGSKPPVLDEATQAAIQAAAVAAAAAAIAQQQRQAAAAAVAARAALPPGAPAAAPPSTPAMPGFIKVSGESDPRKVAGKLAHTCRDNPAPAMLTIGTKCINQAVKAICIARGYLAESQLELTFQTAFREGGTPERPSVALYISKHPNSRWVALPGAVEMAVSGTSQPAMLATALAQRCRDNAPVELVGIGEHAVTNAVMAIGQTRLYLEADGKDVRAWPEFVKVAKAPGQELNAIKFHIHVDRLR